MLKEKQGILVSDAASDDRFKSKQSIIRYGINEVICVPMRGRHETIGVLYLDTHSAIQDVIEEVDLTSLTEAGAGDSLVSGKFNEDHLSLAIAIAHQAALAIEDTRYREAMLQAERLAAVGQTVAALSHHIKNILQGLRAGSDVLKMGLAEEPLDATLIRQGWRTIEKNQGKSNELVLVQLRTTKERAHSSNDWRPSCTICRSARSIRRAFIERCSTSWVTHWMHSKRDGIRNCSSAPTSRRAETMSE